MRKTHLFRLFMLLIAFFISSLIALTVTSVAQQEPEPQAESTEKKAMDPEQEAMMAKYKEYSTPSENHKVLDPLVGKWDHTVKWWMAPGTESEVSTGTSEIKWIMGGRFIKHKVSGTSMGQPFEGLGIMGYDNAKKEFFTFWIDNMGTGKMIGSGTYDPSTKTITEQGTFSCPIEEGGVTSKNYRAVTTLPENDKYTYEWYMPGKDGKEYRAMEIVFTRKK